MKAGWNYMIVAAMLIALGGLWTVHSLDATGLLKQRPPVIPPGARGEIESPVPEMPIGTPPPFSRRQIDPARIRRTTGQLESLLKAVQPEIVGASQGRLPRDLIPHLKRIEKLSKKLRREMSP